MNRSEWILKTLLPAAALLLIAYAIWHTISRRPNENILAPTITPVAAPRLAQNAESNTALIGLSRVNMVAGTGLIEPSSELLELAPAQGGIVRSVAVVAGDQVHAGQLLVQLNDHDAVADVALREAALSSAQRNVDLALANLKDEQAQLALYEGVTEPGVISREELLRRQGATAQAQARARLAQAQQVEATAILNASRVRAAQFVVRAPIDATVLQVRARPGQYAAAATLTASQTSQGLLTLGRIKPLYVRVDIDAVDITRLGLKEGAEGKINSSLSASISPRGTSAISVQTVLVRVEPLVKPKQSLNNAADERVDTRVLQLIFKLPMEASGFFVGQQVDAYVSGLPARQAK